MNKENIWQLKKLPFEDEVWYRNYISKLSELNTLEQIALTNITEASKQLNDVREAKEKISKEFLKNLLGTNKIKKLNVVS